MIHPLQHPHLVYTPDSTQAKVALALFGLLTCTSTLVAIGLIVKFQLFKSELGAGIVSAFLILGFLIFCAVSMRAIHNSTPSIGQPPFKPTFTIEEV